MSIMEAEIQWFIARDGKQHGPVSDLEMRKLVELGHLRPSDLLWRQGFPDWRPAPAVFASQPPFPPANRPFQSGQGAQARARPAMQTTAPRFEPAGQSWSQPAPHSPASQPAFQHNPQSAGGSREASTGGRRAGAPQASESDRQVNLQAPDRLPVTTTGYDDETEPRGRGKRLIAVLLLIAVLGAGGFLAHRNYDALMALTQKSGGGSDPASTPVNSMAAAETAAAAIQPGAATPDGIASIDTRLQKEKHWVLVREEFGEWYETRVREAARLSAENRPAEEIATFLTQGLVELRRAHADKALAASSATLKEMAAAFLANIARLSQESTGACMAFILKGEASPPVVEIIENPQKNAEISAHFAAIFGAVGEGRKSPSSHSDPSEADYQLLVAQLTKLGWTPADLQLFADPKGPTKTTPDRYCTMMQQFFAAHLAVEDAAAQERLLYRTLKLVVAG